MSTPFWSGASNAALALPDVQRPSLGAFEILNLGLTPAAQFPPNPWDTVVVGPVRLPGICEVRVTSARRIDMPKKSATDGSGLIFHGKNPGRVEIKVRIWTKRQLQDLDSALAIIWSGRGKLQGLKDLAFDISHPKCLMHGVSSIVVLEIEGPDPGKVTGELVMTLKCVEFIAPKKGKVEKKDPYVADASTAESHRLEQHAPHSENAPPPKHSPQPAPSKNPADIAPPGFKPVKRAGGAI